MRVHLAPFPELNTFRMVVLHSRSVWMGGHCHYRHTWTAVVEFVPSPKTTESSALQAALHPPCARRCRQAAAGLRLAVSGSAPLPLRLFDGWRELAGAGLCRV